MACSTASEKYGNTATSTRVEVENASSARDTSDLESDLRASLRHALSFSIPPPTFYRNYCPGVHPVSIPVSGMVFGVPLVDVETNQDNVPKVMRICIEELEKRGLDNKSLYRMFWVSQPCSYRGVCAHV